jgi:menaquinone-specific isochorismate synthase
MTEVTSRHTQRRQGERGRADETDVASRPAKSERKRRLGFAVVTLSPSTRVATSASTRRLATEPDLLGVLPGPTQQLCFVHRGSGLVGWGEHARLAVRGADAAERIQGWFADVIDSLDVRDEVGRPGTGPVALISLGFDASDVSVAVVPRVVVACFDGDAFVTTVGTDVPADNLDELAAPATPVRPPGRVSYADAHLSVAGFGAAVRAATARIRAGELHKVVLAHDLEASTVLPIDERFLLRHLAADYPECWTFAVEGLVGASPELLIRRRGRAIGSRVLAGTAWPERPTDAAAAQLMASRKDIAEHGYAVRSVAEVLRGAAATLNVPEAPRPLELANLVHLSTDITGVLDDAAATPTALDLAARLHPTAAVGGSPAPIARQLIRDLEPIPRGRYAAPVGWMDAGGDGEFAIALRCAQVEGRHVRLMAGCGIVADSDPETEAREAQIKMIPIRDALEARGR